MLTNLVNTKMVDKSRREFLKFLGLSGLLASLGYENEDLNISLASTPKSPSSLDQILPPKYDYIYVFEIKRVNEEKVTFDYNGEKVTTNGYILELKENEYNIENLILPQIGNTLNLSSNQNSYGINISVRDLYEITKQYNEKYGTDYRFYIILFGGRQYKPLVQKQGNNILFISNKSSINYLITNRSKEYIKDLFSNGTMIIITNEYIPFIDGYLAYSKQINSEGSYNIVPVIVKGLEQYKVNDIISINNKINGFPSYNLNLGYSPLIPVIMFKDYIIENENIKYNGMNAKLISVEDPLYGVSFHPYSGYGWLARDQLFFKLRL